ncbi:hypothetical protein LRP52_00005 [Photobacterium sp. ZSDE20]|uniref:Lipoprotein n=1 Tax=Photobacterium pectinilyticum TaxID=2906793 RepID=A0ABT1MVD2_9GAMM|nr:hypothetical protein [Photobacterium sp. ZSDE20]MCQ1056448.1 hypothetical protein [Photobacterium sp. ZSDE20]MDD1820583.1 hypothetical protein [Photobacterium sp. ZSDE20]
MNKSLIAIAAASTILTGCVSVKNHDDLLYSNQFSHTHSESHSDAMNIMMKAYNIEPKNPNNLDEFTGDYHSRLARRSNVTSGTFTAMSLLSGASLGSSLLSGFATTVDDKMVRNVKNPSVIRIIPLEDGFDLNEVKNQNNIDVLNAMENSLESLGYPTKHYQHTFEHSTSGFIGRFNENADFFVRTDLDKCEQIHSKLSTGSFTIMDTVRNNRDRELFNSCAIFVSDRASRLVQSYDVDTNQSKLSYVWTSLNYFEVFSAWQFEVFNSLAMDDNSYFYTPSFYWIDSRNSWAQVDEDTMNRAIEHGMISPTPRLKVLDGTNTKLPFSLDDEA